MTTRPKIEGQPKGKPKFPPTTQERASIISMTAAGSSQGRVAKAIHRSRSLVKHTLAEPEVQREVSTLRRQFAEECMTTGRQIVLSIDEVAIAKAGLRDKAVAAGIMIDKALVLSGEEPQYNVTVLLDAVQAIREMRRAEEEAARPQLTAPES